MPLVRVQMLKGKSPEYRRKLLNIIHASLVDALKIPDSDRMQALYELDGEHFERSANKSEDCVVVELTIFKGRSLQAKRTLYRLMTERIERELGIRPADLVIVINEPELENWGVSGVPASEADLGFSINV